MIASEIYVDFYMHQNWQKSTLKRGNCNRISVNDGKCHAICESSTNNLRNIRRKYLIHGISGHLVTRNVLTKENKENVEHQTETLPVTELKRIVMCQRSHVTSSSIQYTLIWWNYSQFNSLSLKKKQLRLAFIKHYVGDNSQILRLRTFELILRTFGVHRIK